MKRTKPRKLTRKIIIALILIFFLVNITSVFLVVVVIRPFRDSIPTPSPERLSSYISGASALGTAICLAIFAYFIHRIIVKRVENLNTAVGEVARGNYSVEVENKGKDEITSLTANFNKMAAELKANEYLNKEFSRNVSHEFKTPLSIIHGYAELLAGKEKDKDAKEKLRVIIEESERLSTMSKSLIEISALDRTDEIAQEDIFEPATQIKTILQNSEMLSKDKKINFDLQIDEFLIKSNETLLYQVWQNLISNAIKFTGKSGTIKIIVKKVGLDFSFEITDNGIGISEADKEKIFSQFFVGDKSRNTDGSGLGLPLAKKIVEKLGGTMNFESTEGQGSTFTVILPR